MLCSGGFQKFALGGIRFPCVSLKLRMEQARNSWESRTIRAGEDACRHAHGMCRSVACCKDQSY